ncbi:MAG TPA: hypothetical protein VJ623_12680 [Holophagaceae bacterium]|nr:hypothetical protein [Holophagaceae bacterium]
MASSPVLVVILLLCALCAILAGMSVFANQKPPDPRMNLVINEMEELKGLVSQLQKSVMAMEKKMEKETRDARTEQREVMEKMGETLDKKLKELVG